MTTDSTTQFQEVELFGGPHDRQVMQVPVDEDTLTLYANTEPHKYFRLDNSPRFFWQSHAMLKGWSAGRRGK